MFGADGQPVVASEVIGIRAVNWFESFDNVSRLALDRLGHVDPVYANDFVGPRELAAGEWIVQLTETAIGKVRDLATVDRWLDHDHNDFTVIAGLGSPGLMLLRGRGLSQLEIEAALAGNGLVESFSLNSVIEGQATEPNDPDYAAQLMTGLTGIDAAAAWEVSRGSLTTVVGVVDSGINASHVDLYLNIWINQGEIPDALFNSLTDIDSDG